ncbi:TIGR00282 family metallophosphoesterase [Fundicoccus culcitae]|uniref:TIGR00282 family metallophosphoesterase n=1 Tax=Fundicoccus culcitae TaxID=2969821 RepID=A0ABY5P7Z0_9LACT|nr:TIGR00282 family metallophosphoesterase [Fundicoccus culcitae]UUX34563.1 TIGR00282 family metallophosphoesterase [Fundicoccus culcitae]
MRVLFIGDIVGTSGQSAIEKYLPQLKKHYRPQFTIANGENISNGRGISEKLYKWLLNQGVNAITLGNHAFDNRDIFNFIEDAQSLIRPYNLPKKTPGQGVRFIKVNEIELAIINVLGNAFMNASQEVFQSLIDLVDTVKERTKHIIIDIHAEASSEKQAIAWLFDGKVTAVLGTHTHVQTKDARILDGGTAYITDVGTTGSIQSIIGFKPTDVIHRFVSQLPVRLEESISNHVLLSAVYLDINDRTGLTTRIEPIYLTDKKYTHQPTSMKATEI